MKPGLKKAILMVLGIISCYRSVAQTANDDSKSSLDTARYRTWSIGINGGISTPYTVLSTNTRQDFTSPDLQIGYGLYIKDQLSHSFGLQADFMMGKLQADHSQSITNGASTYSQSNTKLNWSASLSGNIILAHINLQDQKGFMQPYVTLGGGILHYTPVLSTYQHISTNIGTLSNFYIPIGVGMKINLARGINLDLGYQLNFVMSDDLDGYSYGSTNDRFSYTHIGLEFAIGNRKRPQMAAISKAAAIKAALLANEQALKNSLQLQQMQLDREKNGVNQLKNELDASNARITKLTADSDGDGVPDVYDKCPNTPADTKVDASGCPLPVIVPEIKAEITDADKKTVGTGLKSVEFYAGTNVISSRSFPGLNKVAQLLTSKNLSIKLESYTDNEGDAAVNLSLSKARAEAVKNYLVNRGVNERHIETFGYGVEHPIATNKTPAGRKSNNRIEFTLY